MGSCAGEADTRGQEGPTAEGERDTEESRAQGTGTSRRTATQAGTGEGGGGEAVPPPGSRNPAQLTVPVKGNTVLLEAAPSSQTGRDGLDALLPATQGWAASFPPAPGPRSPACSGPTGRPVFSAQRQSLEEVLADGKEGRLGGRRHVGAAEGRLAEEQGPPEVSEGGSAHMAGSGWWGWGPPGGRRGGQKRRFQSSLTPGHPAWVSQEAGLNQFKGCFLFILFYLHIRERE